MIKIEYIYIKKWYTKYEIWILCIMYYTVFYRIFKIRVFCICQPCISRIYIYIIYSGGLVHWAFQARNWSQISTDLNTEKTPADVTKLSTEKSKVRRFWSLHAKKIELYCTYLQWRKNLEMFGICAQVCTPITVLVKSLVPSIFRLAHGWPEFVVVSARPFVHDAMLFTL